MGSTAVALESNVLFLFPLGDSTGVPKATPDNPTVPGGPKLPMLAKVDKNAIGVPGRSGKVVGGRGEKEPGEDEEWRDWENLGGVNDPTGVLSRTGSILGELLAGGDGRVTGSNMDGDDDVRWVGNWTGFISSAEGNCGGVVGESLKGIRTTITFSMSSSSSSCSSTIPGD